MVLTSECCWVEKKRDRLLIRRREPSPSRRAGPGTGVCLAPRRLQCFDAQADQRGHNQTVVPSSPGAQSWGRELARHLEEPILGKQTASVLWAITPSPGGYLSSHLLTSCCGRLGVVTAQRVGELPQVAHTARGTGSQVFSRASAPPVHYPAPGGEGLCLRLPGTMTQFSRDSDQGQCPGCWPTGQPRLGQHEEGMPGICRCLLID